LIGERYIQKLADPLTISISNCRWILLVTDNQYPFITSDNFFYISNEYMLPSSFHTPTLFMNRSRLFIPLSKSKALMIVNDDRTQDPIVYNKSDPPHDKNNKPIKLVNLIKDVNRLSFRLAKEYVFASLRTKKLDRFFDNLLG